ncbi:1-aminocyclopropane-1-carboxylate deaminase/D-cysteine desulfhydrase [Embleya sp. NBC_00896]|uniref:1-aminocyclopropane-1-carboxylate deaminase/D-cysteine desulfhydrase n=1 Tax=Embleya sp. NBC_00896 TaxID=2975961 RepID=UPI003870C959|nr:pyridoxal-phosphate dependent enzyme [Embleya sp. NBC_00896]
MQPRLPSPLRELSDPRLAASGLRLWLMRDDLIHPEVPGNKWRKLKYNLEAAHERGHGTLLTFGGAYSNHIRATAAAGHALGLATVGVVRGDELADRPLNPSLAFAVERGMRLVFVDRVTYRAKHTPEVLERLLAAHGPAYVLPEGGSNEAAVRGCAELPAELDVAFDVVCVAVGTGGTLAGIAAGLPPGRRAIGFSALRGDFPAREVAELQRRTYGAPTDNWRVETGFHHGGYARRTAELDAFVADFAARHGFAPEPIYVGKMLFGLFELIGRGAFAPGTGIVAVVTG